MRRIEVDDGNKQHYSDSVENRTRRTYKSVPEIRKHHHGSFHPWNQVIPFFLLKICSSPLAWTVLFEEQSEQDKIKGENNWREIGEREGED